MPSINSLRRKGPISASLASSGKDGNHSGARAKEIGGTAFAAATAADILPLAPSTATTAPPKRIGYSVATYQAMDPCLDRTVLEVDTSSSRRHVFAAVITSQATAHGGEYLKRRLHLELFHQVKAHHGAVVPAFKAALASLDRQFRALHIYNSYILEGVQLAAAWLDLNTNTLYVASNGSCRAVVSARSGQQTEVLVELGREGDGAGASLASVGDKLASGMATVQLTEDVDCIMLGSTGLWQELPAQNAALRMRAFHEASPSATDGNAAAHLAHLALQTVTARTTRTEDPRMFALRTPTHLQQLWKGDRRSYRWGSRQPMRRRAGDVHGDLTAIVLHLDWHGASRGNASGTLAKKLRVLSNNTLSAMAALGTPAAAASQRATAAPSTARHWDLLRMHFLIYLPEARRAARQRFLDAVDAAVAAAKQSASSSAATVEASAVPEGTASPPAETASQPEGSSPAAEAIEELRLSTPTPTQASASSPPAQTPSTSAAPLSALASSVSAALPRPPHPLAPSWRTQTQRRLNVESLPSPAVSPEPNSPAAAHPQPLSDAPVVAHKARSWRGLLPRSFKAGKQKFAMPQLEILSDSRALPVAQVACF